MSITAVSPAPLLPRLTRSEAEALNLIAQRVRGVPAKVGDSVWSLTLEPLGDARDGAFEEGQSLVRGNWAGAHFELHLAHAVAQEWLRGRFAELELPALPPSVRAAALESALDDLLCAIGSAGHGPATIASIEEDSGSADDTSCTYRFQAALVRDSATVRATIATDALGLRLIAEFASRNAGARGPLKHGDVPLALRALIGRARLSFADLDTLAPGDAVVLDFAYLGADGEIALCDGGWGFRARPEGTSLTVTAPFHKMEQIMDDDFDDVENGDEQLGDLHDLPVTLHFDLGERKLLLGELTQLQVGQVLEFSRPLAQAVRIRVNGARIGTGELIEVGDRLAVSITSLGGSPRGDES